MPTQTKSSLPKLAHKPRQDYLQSRIVPVGWRKVTSEKPCATFWKEVNWHLETVPVGSELLSLARHSESGFDSAVLLDNMYLCDPSVANGQSDANVRTDVFATYQV